MPNFNKTEEIIMTTEVTFIQVGDLATGFEKESNLLPITNELVNQKFNLYFTSHPELSIEFISDNKLNIGHDKDVSYRATSIRKGIYFVDLVKPQNPRMTITLILDINTNNITLIYGQLPTEQEVRISAFTRIEQGSSLTDVQVEIHFGHLKSNFDPNLCHHYTDELIGFRNQYIYSETEKYEHIYLNENFYAWHCLEGVEKGLADVDRCHYIKISNDLYLFIWREKIVPTLGVILIDMSLLRTDGKIVGYQEADFKQLSNFQVGSFASILNSPK